MFQKKISHSSYVIALCVTIFATVYANEDLDVHVQCSNRGFSGACIDVPSGGIYPNRCQTLWCARYLGGGIYVANEIGRAQDGTYCGYRKECYRGACSAASTQEAPYGQDAMYICSGMPDQPTPYYHNPRVPAPPARAGNNKRNGYIRTALRQRNEQMYQSLTGQV